MTTTAPSPHHDATPAEINAWFQARVPSEWRATAAPEVTVDREEITVVIAVALANGADSPEPDANDSSDSDDAAARAVRAQAVAGSTAGFREATREHRMAIAREAEHRFGRKVAWGVRIDDTTTLFTHLAVPVMTRLRQRERLVLDTLVVANVARSRADALAWCVRLVGRHADDWLRELRTALEDVERLRAEGPAL